MKKLFKTTSKILSIPYFCGEVYSGEKKMYIKDDSILNIFNFSNKAEVDQWAAVNDYVMGGLSKGKAIQNESGNLVFSGSISLENNGGFASIRSLPGDFDLSGYNGIRILIQGDGRSYQFRILTDVSNKGVSFKKEFQTISNTWQEIDLPFDSFLLTYRGQILKNVKLIIASKIKSMGFLIADKKAGSFNLIVDKIMAYK
jgi:monofunctional biosynthetic peptidoglycan transglycosylase